MKLGRIVLITNILIALSLLAYSVFEEFTRPGPEYWFLFFLVLPPHFGGLAAIYFPFWKERWLGVTGPLEGLFLWVISAAAFVVALFMGFMFSLFMWGIFQ